MGLVSAETLREWTGLKTRPAMKRWLGRYGVRWFTDHHGWPITTEEAINQALANDGERERPDFDSVRRR